MVAGLVGGAAPSLGSWDLDLTFDASLMSLDSVSFGGFLGGPADSLQDALENGSGSWDLAEISLLSPDELDALQPASFVLATLDFSALAEGTSSVALSGGVAGDGPGIRSSSSSAPLASRSRATRRCPSRARRCYSRAERSSSRARAGARGR